MKIKSFGCSFIYGSDLSDQSDSSKSDFSQLTWPALIAKNLGVEYECYAWPGQGNFKILRDLITQASQDDPSVMLINWTWIDRFDYVDASEKWKTLRPAGNTENEKFYYRHLHSQFRDMLESAYYVNMAIDFLMENHYPFVMTYMDYNLLAAINPNWHPPAAVEIVQKKISRYLYDFQGKNFLDWSRDQGFAVSDHWHPLDQAHQAAAEYMLPVVDTILQQTQ
jgi:hypothetical protein